MLKIKAQIYTIIFKKGINTCYYSKAPITVLDIIAIVRTREISLCTRKNQRDICHYSFRF